MAIDSVIILATFLQELQCGSISLRNAVRLVDDGDYESLGIHFEVSPKSSEMVLEIHISKIKSVDTDENEIIKEAFEIWQYWQASH